MFCNKIPSPYCPPLVANKVEPTLWLISGNSKLNIKIHTVLGWFGKLFSLNHVII